MCRVMLLLIYTAYIYIYGLILRIFRAIVGIYRFMEEDRQGEGNLLLILKILHCLSML